MRLQAALLRKQPRNVAELRTRASIERDRIASRQRCGKRRQSGNCNRSCPGIEPDKLNDATRPRFGIAPGLLRQINRHRLSNFGCRNSLIGPNTRYWLGAEQCRRQWVNQEKLAPHGLRKRGRAVERRRTEAKLHQHQHAGKAESGLHRHQNGGAPDPTAAASIRCCGDLRPCRLRLPRCLPIQLCGCC